MPEYVVIRCNNLACGRFSYGKSSQKTKLCPYCGKRITVSKVYKYEVDTSEQAKILVQEFNKKHGEITAPKWYRPNEKEEKER